MDKKVDVRRFLGLPASSSRSEVARRCEELLEWLGSGKVPDELRDWARSQRTIVQELYDRLELAEEPAEDVPVEEATVSVTGLERHKVPVRPRRGLTGKLASLPVLLGVAGVLAVVAAVIGVLWWQGVIFKGEVSPVGHDTAAKEGFDPAAFLAERQGRLTELKRTVTADPQNADALFELGETYMIGNDWANAIVWFERLVALQPQHIHALTDLGTAHMNLGEYQEAESYFNEVLSLDPNDAQAHFNTGFLFAFRNDTPNLATAVEHWKEVVHLAPGTELAQVAQVHIDQFEPMVSGSK